MIDVAQWNIKFRQNFASTHDARPKRQNDKKKKVSSTMKKLKFAFLKSVSVINKYGSKIKSAGRIAGKSYGHLYFSQLRKNI